MDRNTLVRQLKAWADGLDPETGELLPADHPAQRPDLIRMFYATLALLEAEIRAQGPAERAAWSPRANGPRNAGRPWSTEDDRLLAERFDAGGSIASLADAMERTRGSITARLVKLGKIEQTAEMRLREPVTHK